MYRAQRLAEFALYDSDPELLDSELDQYLRITADDIRSAVSRYVDVENRVVLDIIPSAAGEEEPESMSAAPQSPGEPKQPTSPPPQIPEIPAPEPESLTKPEIPEIKPLAGHPEQTKDPADVPRQPDQGSGPLHL